MHQVENGRFILFGGMGRAHSESFEEERNEHTQFWKKFIFTNEVDNNICKK